MIILAIILFKMTFAIENVNWNAFLIADQNKLKANSKKIESLNGLESLTYLKSIDLSFNQIKQIDSLKNLTSLESLDLSVNQIKAIDSLKNLKSLRSLHLSNNLIKKIDFS